MIIHIESAEQFDAEFDKGKVLVDFFATWCGPCKMLTPVVEKVSADNPDLKILKVDTDECPVLAKRYDVYSIPTLILFEDGELIKSQAGYMPEPALKAFIGL